MKEQLKQIVGLQNNLNLLINPNWVDNALDETYDYRTAASQELAEAVESFGFAWWTVRKLDMQNVLTELVDAMHFIISQHIAVVRHQCATDEELADLLATRIEQRYHEVDQEPVESEVEVRRLLRKLQSAINVSEMPEVWSKFFAVTKALSFSADHLCARYIAKNLLNSFRQANGYRQGEYRKHWYDGREDNSHVADYVDALAQDNAEFDPEEFKLWLGMAYHTQAITEEKAQPEQETAKEEAPQPEQETGDAQNSQAQVSSDPEETKGTQQEVVTTTAAPPQQRQNKPNKGR